MIGSGIITSRKRVRDTSPQPPGPLFVFGFDDSNRSDYLYAYPEMALRGVRGSSFLQTAPVEGGSASHLTWAQLQEMQVDGWDLQCHTHNHADLSILSEADIRLELETLNALFVANGLPVPRHMTYPYGRNNELVRSIVSEYRVSGRGGTEGLVVNYGVAGFNFLQYSYYWADMHDEAALNVQKARVDSALVGGLVLVSFAIHRIVESEPTTYQCVLAQFQALLDYIIAQGGTIVTTDQAYNLIADYRQSMGSSV